MPTLRADGELDAADGVVLGWNYLLDVISGEQLFSFPPI
jgi:hypothetical protein